MVIVTHEMAFAKQSADKIVFVSDGVIVEEGGPDMLDNPTTEALRAFLQSESDMATAADEVPDLSVDKAAEESAATSACGADNKE